MMGELSLVAKATVVLASALLAARHIPRAAASTRALILTAAFGVLLALPLVEVIIPSRPVDVQLPRMPFSVDVVARIVTVGFRPASGIANSRARGFAPSSSQLPSAAPIVRVVWAIGAVIVLLRLGVGLGRLRALRRTGERWLDPTAASILQQATSRRVHLFLHSSLTAPMTCGVVRPAIGLPADAQHWPVEDLRQALIHEGEHIRRADWLVQVLARAACGLYWFHPLAWSAARNLHLECEHAADDAVVRVGGRASYAQQLVSMARRLSDGVSRPALSMADRRDLARRVDAVLNDQRPRTRLRTTTVASTAIAGLLVAAALAPWRPAAAQSAGAVEDVLPIPTVMTGRAFADVSIRSGDASGSPAASFDSHSGRFIVRNATVLELISHAYAAVPRLELTAGEPYEVHDARITGGAEWMHTERFDIDARAPLPATAKDVQAMLRQLLRDAFMLSVRVDTHQAPAYRMMRVSTPGSSAPGLQPTTEDCADRWNMEGGGPGHIVRRCITLAEFAADFTLTEILGRPVVDRTGVTGAFNVSLTYAPTRDELSTIYELSPSDFPGELFARPSILTAMEQQLGLRLESTRGAVHTLAIDSTALPRQIR